MTILVISYRPDSSVCSMGNVVGHCESKALARQFDNETQAIDYVAHMNAYNDRDAAPFVHLFIDLTDAESCMPGTLNTCEALGFGIDLADNESVIPDALIQKCAELEETYRQVRRNVEAEQRRLAEQRYQDEQRQHDMQMLEYLKKRLGVV